jgi:hypothetical protein
MAALSRTFGYNLVILLMRSYNPNPTTNKTVNNTYRKKNKDVFLLYLYLHLFYLL